MIAFYDLVPGLLSDKLGVWSATANLEAPDVVRQIHEDYLEIGASSRWESLTFQLEDVR